MVRLYNKLIENGVNMEIEPIDYMGGAITFKLKKEDVEVCYPYPLMALEEMNTRPDLIENALLIHVGDFLRYYKKMTENSYG